MPVAGCRGRRGHRRCALVGNSSEPEPFRGQFPASLPLSSLPLLRRWVRSSPFGGEWPGRRAGIGAELASMKVPAQIDAIEASVVNPVKLLAVQSWNTYG